jgi:hypothetical protein
MRSEIENLKIRLERLEERFFFMKAREILKRTMKEGTVAGGGTGDDMMTGRLLNAKGQWEVQERAWGVLELLYPKPGMFRVSLQGFGKNGN